MKVYLMRKRSLASEAADDLLQCFVAHKVLDSRFVAAADRERGKFRTFLLTALDHFLIDRVRHERAGLKQVGLADDKEGDAEPAATDQPNIFDVAWATQVIEQTLRRMREQCQVTGRSELWDLFDIRVVGPTLRGEAPPAYEALVTRFAFASPTQASNALVTAKRMFERTLRAVVIEYAGSDASVDGELRDLRQIVSRAGARSG